MQCGMKKSFSQSRNTGEIIQMKLAGDLGQKELVLHPVHK